MSSPQTPESPDEIGTEFDDEIYYITPFVTREEVMKLKREGKDIVVFDV